MTVFRQLTLVPHFLELQRAIQKANLQEQPRAAMSTAIEHDVGQKALDLKAWVAKIAEQDMPLFGRTAAVVSSFAEDDSKPLSALINVILQDPAMTARVLRIANSAYYNAAQEPLRTVSRAVVVLGSRQVKSICLTVVLIDTLLKGKPKAQLLHEFALAFHAAVQARELAIQRNDRSPEEVFIAALLFRLGEMAFWCFGGPYVEATEELMERKHMSFEMAHRQVLGFPLSDVTAVLAKQWKLGDLLYNAVTLGRDESQRTDGVLLAYEIAMETEHGWRGPGLDNVMQRAASYLNVPERMVRRVLEANAGEAAIVARQMGASKSARLIPVPPPRMATPMVPLPTVGDELEEHLEALAAGDEQQPEFLQPNPQLQLDILREVSSLLDDGKANFNNLIEILLEGIFRGVGMDRAFFALLTPDRSKLMSKVVLGIPDHGLGSSFTIALGAADQNVFSHALETCHNVWYDPRAIDSKFHVTPYIREMMGEGSFFLAPTIVHRRSIGLFYADRMPTGRELDHSSFDSFKLFAKEANYGLEALANTKAPG